MWLGWGGGGWGTWTAYIIVVRVPFLKKVIRSKLCVEECAWDGFRT